MAELPNSRFRAKLKQWCETGVTLLMLKNKNLRYAFHQVFHQSEGNIHENRALYSSYKDINGGTENNKTLSPSPPQPELTCTLIYHEYACCR